MKRTVRRIHCQVLVTQILISGYRDGLAIKSTGSPCRKPGSDSKRPHGGLQPFLTLVPEGLMPSSGLGGYHTHTGTHTCKTIKHIT